MDYNDFAEKCMDELHVLQDKFQKDFDINSYGNWFYNQVTGLLTFSNEEEELNFKYFEVGSFSQKGNTWKWAWDNEDSLENIKNASKDVKIFGAKSKYKKLIEGYFPSDEFDAWEFAAIALKIGNGIGVYRPVVDNQLQVYLIVTEFVDNETAKNIKDKYVQCSVHEYRRRAFVCKHLEKNSKIGFEESFETYEDMEFEFEDDDFQAWCNECEKVRIQQDGWNEVSMAFSNIKMVCEKCYFEMKRSNIEVKVEENKSFLSKIKQIYTQIKS